VTTPYAPAYPFADSPQSTAGRLNAARRFHPERDHTRAVAELAASKIAYAVTAILTEAGMPLPADLADPITALLVGGDAK